MGLKKLRKKYKLSGPYVGNWLKWMKKKIKGINDGKEKENSE